MSPHCGRWRFPASLPRVVELLSRPFGFDYVSQCMVGTIAGKKIARCRRTGWKSWPTSIVDIRHERRVVDDGSAGGFSQLAGPHALSRSDLGHRQLIRVKTLYFLSVQLHQFQPVAVRILQVTADTTGRQLGRGIQHLRATLRQPPERLFDVVYLKGQMSGS